MADKMDIDDGPVAPEHEHEHGHSHSPHKDAGKETDGKLRFEVRKWNAVAFWGWDIVVDTCAICRNHLMENCIECQGANLNTDTAGECVVAWGACNHAFHLHCISRWIKSRAVCPLCNREWSYLKYGK